MSHCWPREDGLPHALGAVALAWLLISGCVLAVRRASGMTTALEPAVLLAAGLLLASIAWFVHWASTVACHRAGRESSVGGLGRSGVASLRLATCAGLVMSGFGVGAMAEPWWPGLAFWTMIVAEEVWAWQRGGRRLAWVRPVGRPNLTGISRAPGSVYRAARHWFRSVTATLAAETAQAPLAGPPLHAGNERRVDGRILQRYVRSATDDGQEWVRGTLRLRFTTGARTAVAHVAFCPPFAQRPKFEARQTGGSAARLKIAQVLPQGARLELRLTTAATVDEWLELDFTAVGT
jgi:hypothetical protein